MRTLLTPLIVILLLIPAPGLAQATSGSDPGYQSRVSNPGSEPGYQDSRFFLDLNLVGSSGAIAQGREFRFLYVAFGEVAEARAIYPKPSRASLAPALDLGGGVMLARRLGVGASYSRVVYEDAVNLVAIVPHPTFLNVRTTETGVTGETLRREEGAIHVFVALVPLQTRRAELRLFGGPTFFRYAAEMVQDVTYEQTFDPLTPQQQIAITGFTSEEARGTDVGFHLGADFTWFLTRVVGVVGGLRFSQGAVTIDREPLSNLPQKLRIGNTQISVGVRLRIGG
jgi:hypothetical protein